MPESAASYGTEINQPKDAKTPTTTAAHCCARRHCRNCGSHDLTYGPRQAVWCLFCKACGWVQR